MVQSTEETHAPTTTISRPSWGSDDDRIVVGVEWEKFDVSVTPVILSDSLDRLILFDRETPAGHQIAQGFELEEDDAAIAGARRAGTEGD